MDVGNPGSFDHQPRTRVVFGAGTVARLGALAAECGRKALVVTDPGIRRAGHVDCAVQALGEAGVAAVVFDDVRPNPTTEDVDRCLAVARGGCPLGVISVRDIVREKCRLEEQDEFPAEKRSNAIMRIVRNSPPIRSGQRLCEAAAAMIEHGLPAVTVVNQSNRLLGLVTEDDLLKVLYDAQA